MKTNIFLKILSSFPIILLALYYFPFLGICLIILRKYAYRNSSTIKLSIALIVTGLIILIPKILFNFSDIIKLDFNKIPYLNILIDTKLYNANFITYSKILLIIGVILLILALITRESINRVGNLLNSKLNTYMEKEAEISRENDLKIKEKQERAKNTHVVYCPNCGADNLIVGNTGVCKFCRKKISYKK